MSLLMPRRTKYRKAQRGKRRGIATSRTTLCFGEYGIRVLENGWLKNTQMESARIVIARGLRRTGKMWNRVFPDRPVTSKPTEVRMGKGKGELDHWVAVIKRGQILFEIGGIPEDYARAVLRRVAHKLPFRTKFVSRGT